jgi:hypothetical protein
MLDRQYQLYETEQAAVTTAEQLQSSDDEWLYQAHLEPSGYWSVIIADEYNQFITKF